ncbi:MAG: 2OG-Fe(II) oxygenase [Acidobacteriaceae bacterium]
MTPEFGTLYRLSQVLQHRRWQVFSQPFLHITAYNVFTPEFYTWVENAYAELLRQRLTERNSPGRLLRPDANFDAHAMAFTDDMPLPLQVFASREWHDMLAALMGIPATGDVNGGFHHHRTASKNGTVHNDLNPGWFIDPPYPGTINLANEELCQYTTGKVPANEIQVHQTARAVAILMFLHNPPWRPGDGGETGLYSRPDQPVHQPTKAIPPINNSIFIFECTPNSYHSFISNQAGPRNSMIMWLHRPIQDAVQRFGENEIVNWPSNPASPTR